MPREFTHLLTPEEARALFQKAFTPRPRGTETVPLLEAFDRVLAADIVADMDLPPPSTAPRWTGMPSGQQPPGAWRSP